MFVYRLSEHVRVFSLSVCVILLAVRGVGSAVCCRVCVCVWACGGCVWEPCAPLFSYIVPLLLQTVNSTKDAQAIVEQDSWGEDEGGVRGPLLPLCTGPHSGPLQRICSGWIFSYKWCKRLPPLQLIREMLHFHCSPDGKELTNGAHCDANDNYFFN